MNPVESILVEGMDQGNPAQDLNDEYDGPFATSQQVLQCQFSSWYPTFSHLEGRKRKNVTIKSVIIMDLPEDLQDFLVSDGVEMPVDAQKLSSLGHGCDDWSSDEEDERSQENEDTQQAVVRNYSFPKLTEDIARAIQTLEGSVMPKLNWSAPKDAAWVNGGSLKCTTPGDVYLLVKSSDFCLHDVLRQSWEECEDYDPSQSRPKLELVLRKWCNLHPSMEFRCFIRGHEMIAISQRNHTQHYAHLLQDQRRIQAALLSFFDDTIRNRFADGQIPNYVMDVYLDQKNKVWLLDFNLWARSTDSLLFEWSELIIMDADDEPQFRLVETANQVRQDPLASYRAPIDTLNLASLTGGTSKNFEDFMKRCQQESLLPRDRDETSTGSSVESLD